MNQLAVSTTRPSRTLTRPTEHALALEELAVSKSIAVKSNGTSSLSHGPPTGRLCHAWLMSSDHILLRVGPEVTTLATLRAEPEPLGSREQVIEELLRICPEPVFEEDGWGWARFELGDEQSWVSVPDEDPVLAVTVNQVSAPFMERLAERRSIHGWRLFDMSDGSEQQF